jgi:hypothetical protein
MIEQHGIRARPNILDRTIKAIETVEIKAHVGDAGRSGPRNSYRHRPLNVTLG